MTARTSIASVLLFAVACSPSSSSDERPCILFVSIDSLRADHLGCYGYPKPTTPTIDAVAAEGVRFETAVSTTSWTLPSHAAMFTGLFDSAHGLFENGLALSDQHVTLADTLREAGYHTAGFFGGPYLHPTYGLNKGFETYQSCMTKIADSVSNEDIREHARQPFDDAHEDVTGPRTIDEVKRWCAKPSDGRPFFMFVHLWDVHYDYIPPQKYVELFDPGYQGSLDARHYMQNDAIRPDMDPRDFQHLVALYDGEIRFTDDNLKEILAAVEARAGGKEKLLIAIVADHGDEFFDHGHKGHMRTLLDELVHVPMIFRWPGHIASGKTIGGQVRTIDLFPTMATAAGAKIPSAVQGQSLLDAARLGVSPPPKPALLELLIDPAEARALRTEKLKVVKSTLRKDDAVTTKSGGFKLDLDPKEQHFVGEQDPDVAHGLDELQKLTTETLDLRKRLHAAPKRAVVDPKLEQRLKELGY